MATPFDGDGEVDHAAAARLATYLLENGSDGLVVAGTTGEAATLTDEEQIDLLRSVRSEVGPDAFLICGSGLKLLCGSSQYGRGMKQMYGFDFWI